MHEAFGGAVSGHNSYWMFMGFVVDSAIYPVLGGDYIAETLGPDNP